MLMLNDGSISIAVVVCLQYVACVVFYHAHERRGVIELLRDSALIRNTTKAFAWCLLIASLILCNCLQGIERGIAIWFCLVSVSGFVSLFVSAYQPSQHVKSGLITLAVALFLCVAMFTAEPRNEQHYVPASSST